MQNLIIILGSIFAALGLLFILRRRLTPAMMQKANDATAFYITVAGTIYAVILAFMVSSVWGQFQDAMINAEQEANALVNVFRLANSLPDTQRSDIQKEARLYARAMISEEWPAMEREEISARGVECVERLWLAATGVETGRPPERMSLQQTLSELSKMTEHRRVRQLQSRFKLPSILWLILIFGAVVTVANSCMLGVEDGRLHALYIVSLTSLVVLVLVAISEIDRPFQGSIHVGPESFQMALTSFDPTGDH